MAFVTECHEVLEYHSLDETIRVTVHRSERGVFVHFRQHSQASLVLKTHQLVVEWFITQGCEVSLELSPCMMSQSIMKPLKKIRAIHTMKKTSQIESIARSKLHLC